MNIKLTSACVVEESKSRVIVFRSQAVLVHVRICLFKTVCPEASICQDENNPRIWENPSPSINKGNVRLVNGFG